MNATYWIEADDRQWQLKKESDAVKPKDGVTGRVTSTLGYYPRFGQALASMHQNMLRETIKVVGQHNFCEAIEKSNDIASRLHNVEPGEKVSA